MPRQTITLRVDYDDEGHVLSITDQRGIFVDRTRMREITQSIQAFYRGISDNELERYVDASTARWQARQDQKRTGDKPGYVYLFESYDGFIKIGQSKNPNERLKGINMPYRPRLIHKIRTSDMDATERYLHQRYAKKRCDGEWFSLSGEDLLWLMSRSTIDVDDSMPVEIVQVGHAIGRPQ